MRRSVLAPGKGSGPGNQACAVLWGWCLALRINEPTHRVTAHHQVTAGSEQPHPSQVWSLEKSIAYKILCNNGHWWGLLPTPLQAQGRDRNSFLKASPPLPMTILSGKPNLQVKEFIYPVK